MKQSLKKLEEFQKVFGHPFSEQPTVQSQEVANLRFALMKEENEEYLEAVQNNDLVGIADALGDQLYILLGTIVSHGMQDVIEKVFDEIHESNMSKLDDNGQPIINGQNGVLDTTRPLGKVLKSKKYKKPNLKQFFNGR